MNANHPFKQLLNEPNFVKLWISQGLSQLTINLVNFSILIRVFETTKSSLAVSFLWLAYSLPALLFAPFSGTIVDRFSRRKMMMLTNFLQALVIGSYLFVSSSHITILYILVFLYSSLDQIYLPSHLSTVMLLTAALAVYLLPTDHAQKIKELIPPLQRYWEDIKSGYAFVREHRSVLFPLLTITLSQIFITVITIILPSYTHQVLSLNLNRSSLTFVVPGGLGALAVTYSLPKILKRKRKKFVIEAGLLLASISLITLALLPWFGNLKVGIAMTVAIAIGASIASIMVPSQTLLQEKTPTWFRGRVYGSLNFLLIIATLIPLLIISAIADLLGVANVIGIIGGLILLCLLFLRRKGDHVLANGIGI